MRHEIILQDPAAGAHFFHSRSGGNSVTPHWHHSLEILYLRAGSLRVEYPDHCETVEAGEFTLINSCTVHAVVSRPNDALVLQIPIELFGGQVENYELLMFTLPPPGTEGEGGIKREVIRELLDQMLDLCDEQPEGYLLAFKSLLYRLLYLLVRDFSVRKVRGEYEHSLRHLDRLQQMIGCIEANYNRRIRVRDIAEMLGYSEDYLSRIFRKQMGIGIVNYLYEIRLGHVYNDLLTSDRPVGEIFEQHGCFNRKLAVRLFRQRYGAAPGELRRQTRR